MDQIVRLYQGTLSSSSWRVRIGLALKGIAYESVRIDIAQDEQLKPEFDGIMPLHQVPCLHIHGHMLYQSVAILEYLDELHPEPLLLPRDPYQRAQVRAVVEVINSAIQPLQNTPVRKSLQDRLDATAEAATAWSRYWLERRLDDLEPIVARTSGRYTFGNSLSMADLFVYPQVGSLWRYGLEMARYPTLVSIANRLREIPAFGESDPQ